MTPSKERVQVEPYIFPILADHITPVNAFLRLSADRERVFLFEVKEEMEVKSRFSYLGVDPIESLRIQEGGLEIENAEGVVHFRKGNPLTEVRKYLRQFQFKKHPALPFFSGGLFGYLGFEAMHFVENIKGHGGATLTNEKNRTDGLLMLFRQVLVFDHDSQKIFFVFNSLSSCETPDTGSEKAKGEFHKLEIQLQRPSIMEEHLKEVEVASDNFSLKASLGQREFMKLVEKVKKQIKAGEVFQCVISEKFSFDLQTHPFLIYRYLRMLSPSPYHFYIKMKGEVLLGASPEMLVRVAGRKVETCPMAGTRHRGKSHSEEKCLEKNLLRSTKEKAEHLMLVDLGRNDLGKVSVPGSVVVRNFMKIRHFSHVMHLISEIQGVLRKEYCSWDALLACFPAGTLSGAPKIRAMQLINELEQEKRGSYGGAVICYDFSGNLNSCIAIRSLYSRNGKATLQAGAGIVADSSPLKEYQEVLHKSKALRIAVASAVEFTQSKNRKIEKKQ